MRRCLILGGVAALALAVVAPGVASAMSRPDFGPNVIVFTPSMSQAQVQSTLDTAAGSIR